MIYPRIRLDKVCRITMGQAPSGDSYNFDSEGLALIAGAGDFGKQTPEPKKFTTAAGKKSEKGEIILCIRATIGDLNWSDKEYCLGRGVAGLFGHKDKLDQKYLWYWLTNVAPILKSKGKGATFLQVTKEDICSLEITLPPLSEQRRIASILDKAHDLRQKRQQAIEKLDQLLQATFIDMFGDPVSNPNNFEQIELDNFILVGPQNGLYKPSNMYGQGIPIVRIDGFKSGDIIDNKEFKRLSLEESDIEKYKLNKFDLVINRVNSPEYIGKTALIRNLEESTVFESNMMRFAVDPSKLDPYYLLFFLKQQFVLNQIANKRKDAVNQSSINQQDVKSLIINVPSIESQLTFSNFFQKIEKLKNLNP